MDEVSFKGLEKVVNTKATKEVVKKNGKTIFAAIMAMLGLTSLFSKKKTENVPEKNQEITQKEQPKSIVDSLNVSPEAKEFGKRLEKLHKNVDIQTDENEYSEYKIYEYNALAVKKVVELYDTDPKYAFELASMLKGSGSTYNAVVEAFVDIYMSDPGLIIEYKNKLETHAKNSRAYGRDWKVDFYQLGTLAQALKKNKEIVDMVISKLDKNDLFWCPSINTLTNFDKATVSKYLNDERVPFDYDDIIKCCELDSKYSKEIGELMDIAAMTMTEEDRRRYPYYDKHKVSTIVEKYAESPEEYKEILKLTGINEDAMTILKDSYNDNSKEFISRLYNDFYKKDYCKDYYSSSRVFHDIVENFEKYEKILNLLDEKGWKCMSDEDFLKNMKSIKQTEGKINEILREADGDISKCAKRVANVVKAHQLPFKDLYKI